MAVQYSPSDPSLVYYGTDTHASALLIGAALALAFPLATLASIPAAQVKRLDAAGVVGLIVLAWASGHFSGTDRAVYPIGLLLAAVSAAGLVAAAASTGLIAGMTSLAPLRWIGIRSYGIYLWHWPVIALAGAITGSAAASPWLWVIEDAVTLALAMASWRFIEAPILRDGFWATCKRWRLLLEEGLRPVGAQRPVAPLVLTVAALTAAAVAGYGIARPASAAPSGLMQQVAEGQQISAESQANASGPLDPPPTGRLPTPRAAAVTAPAASPSASHAAAKTAPAHAQPKVSGQQVTAVGDSVMVASATALNARHARHLYQRGGRPRHDQRAGGDPGPGRQRRASPLRRGRAGHQRPGQRRSDSAVAPPDRIRPGSHPGQHLRADVVGILGQQGAGCGRPAHGHVSLADWHAAIADHTSLLWPDGIHPQPSGAKVYARVVLAAIQAQLPHASPSVCNQRVTVSQ